MITPARVKLKPPGTDLHPSAAMIIYLWTSVSRVALFFHAGQFRSVICLTKLDLVKASDPFLLCEHCLGAIIYHKAPIIVHTMLLYEQINALPIVNWVILMFHI